MEGQYRREFLSYLGVMVSVASITATGVTGCGRIRVRLPEPVER